MPWVATFLLRLAFSQDFAVTDELGYVTLPASHLLPFRLVFLALFVLVLLRSTRVARTFDNAMLFGVLGVVTYGYWNSAVHENHWYVALVPALALAAGRRRWVFPVVAVMLNVNLFVFYGVVGQQVAARNIGMDLSVVLALLFGMIWLLLLFDAWSVPTGKQVAAAISQTHPIGEAPPDRRRS
jgi:hypothetical protein